MSVVLLVGLDEGHSLYQVINWNTTETLRMFLCLSVFGRYIYYCVCRYLGDILFVFVGIWRYLFLSGITCWPG